MSYPQQSFDLSQQLSSYGSSYPALNQAGSWSAPQFSSQFSPLSLNSAQSSFPSDQSSLPLAQSFGSYPGFY